MVDYCNLGSSQDACNGLCFPFPFFFVFFTVSGSATFLRCFVESAAQHQPLPKVTRMIRGEKKGDKKATLSLSNCREITRRIAVVNVS